MSALFKKKTATELRRDIRVLEQKQQTELNRVKLEDKRKLLKSRVRELKYAKAKAFLSKGASTAKRIGSGAVAVGKGIVNKVEKQGVPQPFKVAFPPGRMVAVPRTTRSGPTFSSKGSPARGFSIKGAKPMTPSFRGNAVNAFKINIRRPK